MNLKKPKLLLITFLYLCSNVIAQKDYKPGYIIKSDQDTVHGMINLESNFQNSTHCIFAGVKDQSSSTYKPFEI